MDDHFARQGLPAVRRLRHVELERDHPGPAVAGWRLLVPFADREREVDYVLDAFAPYSRPRVALVKRPAGLSWPHLETNGALCLAPDGSAVASLPAGDGAVGVANSLLNDAVQLVSDCARGRRREDFLAEWSAYWSRSTEAGQGGTPGPELLSLLSAVPPSRPVTLWRGTSIHLLSEDPRSRDRWLACRGIRDAPALGSETDEGEVAALIWIDRPLYPEEFPKETLGLVRLVRQHSTDGLTVLKRVAVTEPRQLVVVLATGWSGVTQMVGLVVSQPGSMAAGKGERRDGRKNGFRAAKRPKEVLQHRYLGCSSPAMRSDVTRIDPNWIHGRDRSPEVARLGKQRVVVIGCGSLGSSIARMLAQAGVGSLLLIDHDTLDWPNISRHVLGADSIGARKAITLAEKLKSEFPHHESLSALPLRWQEAYRRDAAVFVGSDLIVSATGDWNSASALNDLQRRAAGLPLIVHTWLEARAAAAHGVVVGRAGACLRCGFTDVGAALTPVTDFPPDVEPEGRCSAPVSPYGAASISHAHGLAADLCLDVLADRTAASTHRVWIAPQRLVAREGGRWSPSWVVRHGDPGAGGALLDLLWQQRADCPSCASTLE